MSGGLFPAGGGGGLSSTLNEGLFPAGRGGGLSSTLNDDLFPPGGGGGLSSIGLPTGGGGGRFRNGTEGVDGDVWRTCPPKCAFLLGRKAGGVDPKLPCRLTPGTGREPLLCRGDGTGLGVLGTGGGAGLPSNLEAKSGLGGGIRLLCGSGTPLLGPKVGPGPLGVLLGGMNGLAVVDFPPGGSTADLLPPESFPLFPADLSFGIPP